MVYDCFMFFNELHLLELRLEYLSPFVDRFVIAEASETHSGLKKPLFFEENRSMFDKWKDKITYIPVDFPAFPMTAMERDFYQRSCLSAGLGSASDTDLIIVSDLDEIPTPDAISRAAEKLTHGVAICQQKIFYFYLNRLDTSREWIGTAFIRFKTLRENGLTVDHVRQIARWGYRKELLVGVLPNGGFHFSWLGNAKAIKNKLESYAHVEDNIQERDEKFIQGVLDSNRDLLRDGVVHKIVEIDASFPDVISLNIQKYKDLGWIYEDVVCDVSQ